MENDHRGRRRSVLVCYRLSSFYEDNDKRYMLLLLLLLLLLSLLCKYIFLVDRRDA